jgi:hypothetical protein
MFIDPRNYHIYKLPITMLHVHGHSAEEVCHITWEVLVAFGFSHGDFCASCNDNTNAAILANKYITGMAKGAKPI